MNFIKKLYTRKAITNKITDIIIETVTSLFSIIFFMAGPKFPIKKAIKKNLEPRVNIDTRTKKKKLKCTNPLVIVSNLNGTGVKPAIANKVIHAMTPPSEDILSFKKLVLSTPYNSNIFTPISLKKT